MYIAILEKMILKGEVDIYDFNSKTKETTVKGYVDGDGAMASNIYKKTGKVMPLYVYHRYTRTLYQ